MVQEALVLMRVAGVPAFSSPADKCHAEAGGVGCSDQLLRIGAAGSLESGGKGVVTLEGAGAGLEMAAPGFQASLPDCTGVAGWHFVLE